MTQVFEQSLFLFIIAKSWKTINIPPTLLEPHRHGGRLPHPHPALPPQGVEGEEAAATTTTTTAAAAAATFIDWIDLAALPATKKTSCGY